jgi:hypothetical protein
MVGHNTKVQKADLQIDVQKPNLGIIGRKEVESS